MSTPDPCPSGLMERFGAFIARLRQAIADGSGRNKALMGPLTILLWNHLGRTLRRLAALHARFRAGTLQPRRPRASAACEERTEPAAETQAQAARLRMPHGPFLLRYGVAHLHHGFRELMADAEMLALLEASPEARRLVRALWRKLLTDPLPQLLRVPPRPRRQTRPGTRTRQVRAAPVGPAAPVRPADPPGPAPPGSAGRPPDPPLYRWTIVEPSGPAGPTRFSRLLMKPPRLWRG